MSWVNFRSTIGPRASRAAATLMVAASVGAAATSTARAQDPAKEPAGEPRHVLPPAIANLPWQNGPCTGKLENIAEIKLSAPYRFLGKSGAQTVLRTFGNLTDGTELGLVGPPDLDWFVVFEWDDCGYVKDDEKIDADAILKSLKDSDGPSNEARKAAGLDELHVVGWEIPAHYDKTSNSLVWATRLRSGDGGENINYQSRRLGRAGVMRVTMVCDPEDLKPAIAKFDTMMAGYSFAGGQKYAEFKPGDKIAEYGLAALITGGVAAVAVKSGLLKVLWKPIAIAIAAIGAVFAKIFRRKSA